MDKNKKNWIILLSSVLICVIASVSSISNAQTEKNKQTKQTNKKSEKIKFVAVGDAGTGGIYQYNVAKAMKNKCENNSCDFGLMLGDNIYEYGVSSVKDSQFITKFELPYKDLNFPFYMVLGNHDYLGNPNAQVEYTKKSNKWIMPSRAYSFSKGIVDFFAIDSNSLSLSQEKDLIKKLDNSKARWKIVFAHHPRYSNGLHGNASYFLGKVLDNALCNRADMYIAGHDHNKEHLKKVCGVEYLVVGSGGGSLRPVRQASNSLFAKSSYGFSWFEVDKNSLHFQFIDTDGKVEYEYTTKK